jgi:polyhydroxybutyrate depolymerase
MRWMIALLLLCTPALAEPRMHVLPDGRYLAIPPSGWDGATPLAATIFLHGVWSSPEGFAAEPDFLAAFATDGVLLLMPAGANESWTVPGAPRMDGRDDVAFLDAVRLHAAGQYPIDPARLRLSGFSLGASMAFHYACRRETAVQAVLTIGGVPWQPLPEACAGRPVPWLHIHGETDPTWPLTGRTIRTVWRQAAVVASLEMLARSFACAAPIDIPAMDGLACTAFRACAGAAEVRSCRHPGAHDIEPAWFHTFHAWAGAVSPGAPAR